MEGCPPFLPPVPSDGPPQPGLEPPEGLGPPEPWLVEAVKGVALVEAGLEGEARTPLATPIPLGADTLMRRLKTVQALERTEKHWA